MYKVDCWRKRVCDHDTFLRIGTALKTKAKVASFFCCCCCFPFFVGCFYI